MGKGAAPTIGFWYGLTMHMGLSHGPLDAILEIRGDDKPMFPQYSTPAVYNDDGIMLSAPSGALQPPITASGAVAINQPNLYGGEKQEGGVDGTLTVLMGEQSQMPSPALAAIESGSRPAYRNIASAAFTGLVAAMSPYIKPWSYRVSRYVQGWNTPVWHPELVQIGRGMNPAHIVYQCITDPVWSASEDAGTGIDEASFLACAQTLYTEGLGLCLKWSSADQVGTFISTVLDHIAALRYIDPSTNRVGLRLLRNDYDPVAMALDPANILDENDIIEMTSFQPQALDESVNEVVVTYHDVATNRDISVTYQNLANIQAQGKVVSQSVAYPGAWCADIGARLAARDCHTLSSLLTKGECTLKSTRWQIKCGDVLLLNWAREKCVLLPIRVLKVNYGDSTNRSIVVTWAQDEFGVPASAYVSPVGSQWQEPSRVPVPITTQELMEIPYRDLARSMDAANLNLLTEDACFIAALGARPLGGIAYHFDLATRVGSAGFVDRGPGDFVNGGALANAIGLTDTTIQLTGFDDLSRVKLLTAAKLENELLRVDALDTVNGLVTIGRGCVDTAPAIHAAGARLWFYQDYAAADVTEYVASESVDAKLLTVSPEGMLPLDQATTITLLMAQRQARPYPPGNLRINGLRYPAFTSVELVVAWSHRDRLLQADQLIDTLQSDIGPEPGTTYTVNVYLNNVLDSTHSGIAGNTYTPAVSGNGQVRVEVSSQRDDVSSWLPIVATFGYTQAALSPLEITGAYVAATLGAAYSSDLAISGGSGTYSNPRVTTGTVPAGLVLSIVGTSLNLAGTPTSDVTEEFTVTVDSSDGQTASSEQTVNVSVPTLAISGTYPSVQLGGAYSNDLTITGGDGAYTLSGSDGVASGALPAGLALSIVAPNKLRLSGTSSGAAGSVEFTVSVSSGDGQTAMRDQTVVVADSLTDPLFDHVVALLSMDDTPESDVVNDKKGNVWAFAGGASMSDAQSKWGTYSLDLTGGGKAISSNLASIPGDVTLEAWFYSVSLPSAFGALFSKDTNHEAGQHGSHSLAYYDGGYQIDGGPIPSLGSWHYYKFLRSGGVVSAQFDDVVYGSGSTSMDWGGLLFLGANNLLNESVSGYLGPVRITAAARTSTDVPTGPFPTS